MNSIKSILFSMAIISGPMVMASEPLERDTHKVSHMCGFKALRRLSDDAFDKGLMRLDASREEITSSTVTRRILSVSANNINTLNCLEKFADPITVMAPISLTDGKQSWTYDHEVDSGTRTLQDLCNHLDDRGEGKFPQDFLKLNSSEKEPYTTRQGCQVWKVEGFKIILWKTADRSVTLFEQKKPLYFPRNTEYENRPFDCGCCYGPYVSINLKHEGKDPYKGWTGEFFLINSKGDSIPAVLDNPWTPARRTAGKAASGGGGGRALDSREDQLKKLREAIKRAAAASGRRK
jgi:hypothetical protein